MESNIEICFIHIFRNTISITLLNSVRTFMTSVVGSSEAMI